MYNFAHCSADEKNGLPLSARTHFREAVPSSEAHSNQQICTKVQLMISHAVVQRSMHGTRKQIDSL
jgi:hypothetical protein